MIFLTIARPRPVPAARMVTYGSVSRSAGSGRPQPLSCTSIRQRSRVSTSLTITHPGASPSSCRVIRSSTDEAERTAAAEDLNRYFAEQVFNVWSNWVYWGLAHRDNVYGVVGMSIPGAEDVRAINMGANLPGVIMPAEIFKTS